MGWKLSGKVFYCVTVRICEAYTEWDIRLTQLLRKLSQSYLSIVFQPRSAEATRILALASCNRALGILLVDNGG